jgi:rare lipoprotein A
MNTLARTKQLRMAIFVMLVTMAMAGNAAAQTSEEGVANFYSDKFEGKKTASGEVYDKSGLTAAHKKLPYGTKVKVTNVANGKSVVLTVNDRMARRTRP